MSALKTYDRPFAGPEVGKNPEPWPFVLVDGCGDPRCDPLAPGKWVTHTAWGGFGMVVAINDDQITILWSEEPQGPSFTFPNVRRVNTVQVAQSLLAVQPMSLPSGLIFYLDYQYGDWRLDPRCNTGPRWLRLFWRAWLCTSTRTRLWWSSFWSWARSWSSRKPTSASNVDSEKPTVRWPPRRDGRRPPASGPRTPPGKTAGPSEEADGAPRTVPEKPVQAR